MYVGGAGAVDSTMVGPRNMRASAQTWPSKGFRSTSRAGHQIVVKPRKPTSSTTKPKSNQLPGSRKYQFGVKKLPCLLMGPKDTGHGGMLTHG